MDPISGGVMMAAAGMKAVGSIVNGYTQAANSRAQAQVDELNAATARQYGQNALQEASANEDAIRRKSAQAMSSQAAGIAESGIGMDSGTAVDITAQSALNAEIDALNVRYGGVMKSKGYADQAMNFENQAAMARANAKQAVIQGWMGAGSSALSGVGSYMTGQAGAVRATLNAGQ